MKKIVVFLTILACVGILAACGSESKKEKKGGATLAPGQTISVVPANSTETRAAPKKTVIVTAVPSQKPTKEVKTEKPNPKMMDAKGGNIVDLKETRKSEKLNIYN